MPNRSLRVAIKAATLLRGKDKPIFTRTSTLAISSCLNADKVRLTGKKEEQRVTEFFGYVGGHKSETARARRLRHPY